MPELPEVETVVRGLRPSIEGRRILACPHASRLMARCDKGDFRRRLAGQRFQKIDRHGKWMFFRLAGGDTLVIHLGMTGHLCVLPADTPAADHTHLRIALDSGNQELRLSDPRRFGELLLCGPGGLHDRFGPGRLGPEATTITLRDLRRIMAKTTRAIKAVLLDQRSIAGIGNIYADEILFDARIHPARRGRDLQTEDLQRLTTSIRRVLARAIRAGGSTIRDYVNADGRPGWFQLRHRVYGRDSLPCKRCQSPVQLSRAILAGRATHFCPKCQPIR